MQTQQHSKNRKQVVLNLIKENSGTILRKSSAKNQEFKRLAFKITDFRQHSNTSFTHVHFDQRLQPHDTSFTRHISNLPKHNIMEKPLKKSVVNWLN